MAWSPYYGGGGYFDYGNFHPWLVAESSPAPGSTARRLFDTSQLVDQTQMFDPLFNPSQMVDLSRNLDLSRTRGTASSDAILSGPGVVGLFGLFEGDFVGAADVAPDPPPRPRGLLLLGKKTIKKAWKPRTLAVAGRRGAVGVLPMVDCVARGEMFARGIPWWR